MHERTISKNRFFRTWDGPLVRFQHGQNIEFDNFLPTITIVLTLNSAIYVIFFANILMNGRVSKMWIDYLQFCILIGGNPGFQQIARVFRNFLLIQAFSSIYIIEGSIEPSFPNNSITIGFDTCICFQRFQASKYLWILEMHGTKLSPKKRIFVTKTYFILRGVNIQLYFVSLSKHVKRFCNLT